MNKIITLAFIAVLAFQAQALVVETTAGKLPDVVTDLNIKDLTVTGTIDASDLYFISDKLRKLETLHLDNVSVVSCHTDERHYWQRDFVANEIPVGAFGAMGLKQVTLPSSVRSIGKAAFAGCTSLSDVTLPAGLDSIADLAFAGCSSLTAIMLPASVRIVGYGAFMRCTSLTQFAVESASRLIRMDESALMDCPALQSVSLGNSVQRLGDRVFAGTGIQNLDLSASSRLTSVGEWTMVKTPVVSVKMPESLTDLGAGAFLCDVDLNEAQLGGSLSRINDYMFAGTGLDDLDFTGVAELGKYALYNVNQMQVVELPATMTRLDSYAMAGMVGMTSITCHAEQVPSLGSSVWKGVNQSKIPLTVPESSKEAYQSTYQWRDFMFETTWLRGDVNGDGEVNIADINAVVGIILGRPTDDDTRRRADVNNDGEVNIADINAVVNIIFHPQNIIIHRVDTDDELNLDEFSITPGEKRVVTLKMEQASAYSAMQCDITLPQGLSLVGITPAKGRESELKSIDGSAVRAMTYSMEKEDLDGGDGIVLKITVEADESLANEGEIVVSNIVLSDDNDVAWHAADCSARVVNKTGIEDLTACAERVWVEGRTLCIETTVDGNAIVVAVNGISRGMELHSGVNYRVLEPGFYVVRVNGKSHKITVK